MKTYCACGCHFCLLLHLLVSGKLPFLHDVSLMAGKDNGGDCDVVSWFGDVAGKADEVQTRTLAQILRLNYGVEYLRKWIGEVENVDEMDDAALENLFRSRVPLASHADLEPYIQRIADGDSAPLLTQQPITTLSLSSGTTEGRQKYVPFTSHSVKTTLQLYKLGAAHRSRVYPIREGGRVLELIYSSKQFRTKGGLKASTATSHVFASEEYKIKQQEAKCFTCSPQEVISSGDYRQSTYCHLLLGLNFSDEVESITSTFAYSMVQAFRTLEEVWREICNDLRQGSLSSRITIPEVRKTVLDIIVPNPSLASRIEARCEGLMEKDWFDMIHTLWPNAKYLYSIMTGSMQPYLKKLRHYAGDLPLVSADYGSTESWIGANIDPSLPPEKVTFAVVPTFSYFEFIPLHRQNGTDVNFNSDDFLEEHPVPLSEVKDGQEYEIVLTTFTGLYRYRLGDVVQVAGFHKKIPKLNFICRRKLILTVNIDKNTENDLQMVVERGLETLLTKSKAELVDFTSHADVARQPGHYVVYWEIDGEAEDAVLGQCCHEMDAGFVDHGYVVSRRTNSIGPLELCIVEKGTFNKILEHFIRNGAAFSQFKTPRCTTNEALLSILECSAVKRFYSTAYA